MSADEILGRQFVARRAAQLKAEGQSLQRIPPPPADSLEAAKARHPAGKRRGPTGVVEGGGLHTVRGSGCCDHVFTADTPERANEMHREHHEVLARRAAARYGPPAKRRPFKVVD